MDKARFLYNRVKTDQEFRQIFIIFICSCFSFCVLGWNLSQGGPTLLDLQIISQCSLDEASLFFTALAVGYIVSSLLTSVTFDRFDKLLQIFLGNLGVAVVMATIPWSIYYELMFTMHMLKGFACGISDTVISTLLIHMFGQECRTYIQVVHFFFTVGGMISPLASAPFLAEIEAKSSTFIKNITERLREYENITHDTDVFTHGAVFNITNRNTETEVYKAYTISAVLSLMSALSFLVMYFKVDKNLTMKSSKDPNDKPSAVNRSLPLRLKVPIFIIIICCTALFTAMEDSFVGLLATFVVEQFNWGKTTASYVTSLFWACFAFGSLFAIFVAPFFKLSKFLVFYAFMVVFSFTGLLIITLYDYDNGVWITTSMNGFFMSVFFPLFYAWTEEEFIHVSARITTLITISSGLGVVINPIILGQLMLKSTIWFCYVLLVESILLAVIFYVGMIAAKKTKSFRRLSKLEIEMSIADISSIDVMPNLTVNISSDVTKF